MNTPEYYADYYKRNRDYILKRKRIIYANDENYRNALIIRSRVTSLMNSMVSFLKYGANVYDDLIRRKFFKEV